MTVTVDHAVSEQSLPDAALAGGVKRGVIRTAVCVAFPLLASSVMVGGVFLGASPRVYAVVASLLGLGLALAASHVSKPPVANAIAFVGLFAIGAVVVIPRGAADVVHLQSLVDTARAAGNVLRPPVPFSPGWTAIVGWLMGMIGFAAGWIAFELRRPALALIFPLPVAAIAGISVPQSAQVVSGIVVLALFAIGLGLLSGSQDFGAEGDRPSIGFEIRRGLKSLPLIAVITAALYFLAQAHVLFPHPVVDPTHKPQKPATVPLSKVKDRVLFSVVSKLTGPWRMGSLDVYDGKDWRLPPFAQSKLAPVPATGIVDPELKPGIKATFTIAGLTGAVLPGLPNPVGLLANGPQLAYDARSGNVRTQEGEIRSGLTYSVVAAALPSVGELRRDNAPLPAGVSEFASVPPPPTAVLSLIARAPKGSKWDEFDYIRRYILDNVTAAGPGIPVSVPPSRVQDMLAGSKQGSPYEIVAAQALLARWIGIPSRIGYGFDGGESVNGQLQIRPKDGATFVEVYFPNFKWLPVIGTPKQAKATLGNKNQQKSDPNVVPSNDISVQVFIPRVVPASSVLLQQIKVILLITLPAVLLLILLYLLYPAAQRAILRSRRRKKAYAAGPRARVALAYAEWRDWATDYGYRHDSDTPLRFLEHFVDDREHTEFAWLVTRCLWGDLASVIDDRLAAGAEELSRVLRRRLAQTHPVSLRLIAAISRMSLRYPYAALFTDEPSPTNEPGPPPAIEKELAHAAAVSE